MINKISIPVLTCIICALLTAIVSIACTENSTTTTSSGPLHTGTLKVHMNDRNFVQQKVTIAKGQTLTLISDTQTPHDIENGSWSNGGTQDNTAGTGAPQINQAIMGNSQNVVGPFDSAGTFHLFCTIHVGMDLTVIVTN